MSNREIKFRAWDEMARNMFGWEDVKQWQLFWLESEVYQFSQFTGLHDITHEELYEGDIVMRLRKGKPIRSKIVFEEGSFKLSQTTYLNSRTIFKFRVNKIGNIYENPELLNP